MTRPLPPPSLSLLLLLLPLLVSADLYAPGAFPQQLSLPSAAPTDIYGGYTPVSSLPPNSLPVSPSSSDAFGHSFSHYGPTQQQQQQTQFVYQPQTATFVTSTGPQTPAQSAYSSFSSYGPQSQASFPYSPPSFPQQPVPAVQTAYQSQIQSIQSAVNPYAQTFAGTFASKFNELLAQQQAAQLATTTESPPPPPPPTAAPVPAIAQIDQDNLQKYSQYLEILQKHYGIRLPGELAAQQTISPVSSSHSVPQPQTSVQYPQPQQPTAPIYQPAPAVHVVPQPPPQPVQQPIVYPPAPSPQPTVYQPSPSPSYPSYPQLPQHAVQPQQPPIQPLQSLPQAQIPQSQPQYPSPLPSSQQSSSLPGYLPAPQQPQPVPQPPQQPSNNFNTYTGTHNYQMVVPPAVPHEPYRPIEPLANTSPTPSSYTPHFGNSLEVMTPVPEPVVTRPRITAPPSPPPPPPTTPPTPKPTAPRVSSGNSERGGERGETRSATTVQALTQQIRRLPAVLYVDSRQPGAKKTEQLLREMYGLPLVAFYVDKIDGSQQVARHLEQLTAHKGLPYLFICGTFIGSEQHIENYHKNGQIPQLVEYVCGDEKKSKVTKTTKAKLKTHSTSS